MMGHDRTPSDPSTTPDSDPERQQDLYGEHGHEHEHGREQGHGYGHEQGHGHKHTLMHRRSGSKSSSVRHHAHPLEVLQKIQAQHPHHPIHWHPAKKWLIVTVYCVLQIFISMASTSYVFIEPLIQAQFGGSVQLVTLGQSLLIVGTAIGPLFLGPLSDIGGRKWVYVASTAVFGIFNIFLCGAAGSTALCNVAGTVADLFGDMDGAGLPRELIYENTNLTWPWLFWINVIISAGFSLGLCFVPETLPHMVISREQRKSMSDTSASASASASASTSSSSLSPLHEIGFVFGMALRILFTEPIVAFLGVYNGYAYGLLFLFLDGVWDVYAVNNGLSPLQASLTFLNLIPGVSLLFVVLPLQTWLFKRDRMRHGGGGGSNSGDTHSSRPEARFLTSLVAVWLYPAGLFWFAFTSGGNVSFWSPLVAGSVLAFADPLLYLSMLNYITDSYPNVAASAVAAFLVPSFLGAAAFAHLGLLMFDRFDTTWAIAILAFVSLPLVALVYVLYFCGPRIRAYSRLAKK